MALCVHNLPANVIVVLLLTTQSLAIHLKCEPYNDNRYENCSTDFAVLERALMETCDNRFQIISSLLPPRESTTLYANVTYTFLNTNVTQRLVWSSGAFYFIQTPSVLRFTSLLFVWAESRKGQLDLHLPAECVDVTKTRSHGNGVNREEGMLEVLTQRLLLYAKFNSLKSLNVPDKQNFMPVAIPEDHVYELYDDQNPYVVAVFFSLTLSVPLLIIPFFWLVLKSSRIQLRTAFHDPSWYPNFAACVGIAFWFPIFVIAMDICGIYWTFSSEQNELNTILHDTNGPSKTSFPLNWFIVGQTIIDVGAALIGLAAIFTAACSRQCRCCFLLTLIKYKFLFKRVKEDSAVLNELRLWWLCCSFVAPLMCLGSHLWYVIVGWLINPSRGGAIFVAYIRSGLYFFIMFRMVYNCVDDRVFTKKTHNGNGSVQLEDFADVDAERQIHDHRNGTTHEFSYAALIVVLCSGILFAAIEGYILVGFILLPITKLNVDPPEYLLTLFEIAFLVVTVMAAYKYVSQEPPLVRAFLMNVIQNMRYYHDYRPKNQQGNTEQQQFNPPRQVTEVEKASAVVGALVHNYLLMEEGRLGNDGAQPVRLAQMEFLNNENLPEENQCLNPFVACWQWCRHRGYEKL